jgi:hypothetical protein
MDKNRPKIGHLGLLAEMCIKYNREFDKIINKHQNDYSVSISTDENENEFECARKKSILPAKSNKRKLPEKDITSEKRKKIERQTSNQKKIAKKKVSVNDLQNALSPFEILSKQDYIQQYGQNLKSKRKEAANNKNNNETKFNNQTDKNEDFKQLATQIISENMIHYLRIKSLLISSN